MGVRPLGTDFGNGPADGNVFLFDHDFARYREAKLRARAEQLEKYYPTHAQLSGELRQSVARFIVEKLVAESPQLFAFDGRRLRCALTSDELEFSPRFELTAQRTQAVPAYRDELDALGSNLQEDLAIWASTPINGGGAREWLAAVHLCFPNHWAAQEKIGRAFGEVHAPVAGFERLVRSVPNIVEGMVAKGPFVRFAWGVGTDDELNHHPHNAFQGRTFDPSNPRLFLRVERQTISSFPTQSGALFTIRTFFLNCATDLSREERQALAAAIDSMSPESLRYKGLAATQAAITAQLLS